MALTKEKINIIGEWFARRIKEDGADIEAREVISEILTKHLVHLERDDFELEGTFLFYDTLCRLFDNTDGVLKVTSETKMILENILEWLDRIAITDEEKSIV